MKTILLVALNVIISSSLLAITPNESSVQSEHIVSIKNDVFERFNAHRQQNGIALSWTFSPTSNFSHFIIEKSYDGYSFSNLGQVSINEKGMNRYYDDNVYPGFIHYRIKAVYSDGSVSYSQTDVVRIVRNG